MMNKSILLAGILAVHSVCSNPTATADPIYDAVQEGDFETVKKLVEEGVDVNKKGIFGHPPLNHAAACGHKDVTEYLISKGADINGRDLYGSTPLHTAAFWAQKEISVILISNGAEINSKDNIGLTPLHAAAGGHDSNDFGMVMTAIAITGNEDYARDLKEISELLISKGANVNTQDKAGLTPLHWASSQGRDGIVEFLISKGADINSRSKGSFLKKGKTPLGLATEAGHKDIIRLLKLHGAEE